MQTNKILSAPLIDLIFDGRNKEYGAYYLRKTYERRIKKALIFTFSIVFLAVGGTALAGKSKRSPNNDRVSGVVELIDLPPEEKIVQPPPKQEPPPEEVQIKQEKFVDMIIVDKEVIETPPSQESLIDSKIGLEKIEGVIDNMIASPEVSTGVDNGVIQKKIDKNDDAPLAIVEIDAKFIGDWKRFLLKNLDGQTPLNNGAPPGRYTVIIQFVVNKEGDVSDIKALTSHGYGLEAEAIRVLKKATKWEPAIQNGYKVKAYHKQLITFDVPEE
jgi:protein TonB